jgi:trans-AT polyketide synthase/acyltransferase/oxidoreductase domain-containing protein
MMETPLTTQILNGLRVLRPGTQSMLTWRGPENTIAFDDEGIINRLLNLDQPVFIVQRQGQLGVTILGEPAGAGVSEIEILAQAGPLGIDRLGDPDFARTYGVKYAYYTGSMANAIASEQLVIALGKAGILGAFGSAGVVPARLEGVIQRIQQALPHGPYAFNLIHSPNEEAMERGAVELFLKHRVTIVEASAFLDLTPNIVHYRVAGLQQGPSGEVLIGNRVIAKLSRKEVAAKFMSPAPQTILSQLVQEGRITPLQAELAEKVPMADDITAEADSGGHTDNRPLVGLLPTMIALRDEIQERYHYANPPRVGAAGGISSPGSALAAFSMGAAFVATGTVNQACVEAGTSEHTRQLLAKAEMTDVIMAPSADMFEMGVKVQLLKAGTLFPMRAQKLYDLYLRYNSIDEIPTDEREKLVRQIFRRDLEDIWADTVKFFAERDPEQITRANDNPKRKMALIFRWYLGLSSRWSNSGEKGREMDYQIWCGPSIGTFNDWTRGTYLAEPPKRRVVDVALHILTGCAYQYRVQVLKAGGVGFSTRLEQYRPSTLLAS